VPKLIEIAGDQPGRVINLFDLPILLGNVPGIHHAAGSETFELHVRIFVRNGVPYLCDLSEMGTAQLNSKTLGIYQNGADIELKNGDTVGLGSTIFRIEREAVTHQTRVMPAAHFAQVSNATQMMDPIAPQTPYAAQAQREVSETYVWDREEEPPVWPRVLVWSLLSMAVAGLLLYVFYGMREVRKPMVNNSGDLLIYKPGQFWQYDVTGGQEEAQMGCRYCRLHLNDAAGELQAEPQGTVLTYWAEARALGLEDALQADRCVGEPPLATLHQVHA